MIIGMLLVLASAIWLSTRQSLSVKSRMLRSHSSEFRKKEDVFNRPNLIAASAKRADEDTTKTVSNVKSSDTKNAERIHIVQKGETLSQISARYFGSADNWKKILDANKKNIKNPNKLIPGTRLFIPD